jgi:uncharacterized membrane protein YjfL (UPF0719 family)
MESNWAADNLQTIRTLMERSALYRRALAPVMALNGVLGLAGAAAGRALDIASPRAFIFFWGAVAFVALTGSFLLVRRQALGESEPFWSPPTRRVTQAFLPPLVAGLIAGAVVALHAGSPAGAGAAGQGRVVAMLWLPLGWVVLYGCALHAAGFYMPRGMKILGWFFVLSGSALLALGIPDAVSWKTYAHGIMGLFFGLVQLGYGIYLYFTEKGKNAA